MKIMTLLFTICFVFTVWAQSSAVIKGEYIFVSSIEKEHQSLKNDLKKYGPFSNTALNKTSTLWRFKKDPGLKQLQLVIKKHQYSGTIQPNLVYKLIKPVSPDREGLFPSKEINLKQ